jgi:hypothetical protein
MFMGYLAIVLVVMLLTERQAERYASPNSDETDAAPAA